MNRHMFLALKALLIECLSAVDCFIGGVYYFKSSITDRLQSKRRCTFIACLNNHLEFLVDLWQSVLYWIEQVTSGLSFALIVFLQKRANNNSAEEEDENNRREAADQLVHGFAPFKSEVRLRAREGNAVSSCRSGRIQA